jgi:hypothetical protein
LWLLSTSGSVEPRWVVAQLGQSQAVVKDLSSSSLATELFFAVARQ